jgi:hypothetical protein
MLRLSLLSLLLISPTVAFGCGGDDAGCPNVDTPEFTQLAAKLRQPGPEGLAIALRQYRDASDHVERTRFRFLVDQVAGQRDATVSKLYWYTDFEQAKQAAAETGRPILSLHMLGKLTDEFSCANSRFFRTALYANKEISDYLRDNFVLHWESVRPVPRVTVDFGDGRKLERTITGNSAHYVLDSQGRPLDVLPGLYGPKAFAAWLQRAHDYERRMVNVAEEQRHSWLTSYHREQLAAVNEALRSDLAVHAANLLQDSNAAAPTKSLQQQAKPTAREAAFRAVTKTAVEAPLVAPFVPANDALQAQGDELWRRIAATRADQSKLDEASINLICGENPTAVEAGGRAAGKFRVEDPIVRMLRNFEEAMALDAVKNEYLLHRQIHQWYLDGTASADVRALNERVYAELFLTPSSDPWLGLAPGDVYTALDGCGLTETQAAK